MKAVEFTSTTAADESTIAAASSTVDVNASNSTAELFASETLQLTDAVLANLTGLDLSNVSLFSFDSLETGELARRAIFGKCKTYPGDLAWPSKPVWKLFDILLGGALIETVPYAAPCYDEFGNFDPARCDFITTNWVNGSIFQ